MGLLACIIIPSASAYTPRYDESNSGVHNQAANQILGSGIGKIDLDKGCQRAQRIRANQLVSNMEISSMQPGACRPPAKKY